MTLSINTNLQYDEALGFNSTDVDNDTDSNVASLTADLASAISTQYNSGAGWTYYSAPTGFPQFAEMSNFVTSDQAVTSYFLASDNSGDGFATSGTGVATSLYVGAVNSGDEIFLYGTSDPNVVIGRIGGATGAVALVIALHGDPAHPELGVAVYAPITDPKAGSVDDADALNLDGLIYLGSNFSTTEEHDFDTFAGVPSGSDQFAMIKPDTVNDLQLLVTGFTGTTEQKITISQDATQGSIGGGGSGQHVGSGNSLRIDFVTGGNANLSSSQANDFSNLSYTGHAEADKASFTLVQVNPGSAGTVTSLNIFAYDNVGNDQGTSFPSTASANEGTVVALDKANVQVLNALGHVVTSGVTITNVTGGGVHITGLQTGYTVVFSAPGTEFDRFTITNTQPATGSGSNVTFDVGHIHVTTVSYGNGTDFTNIGDNIIFEDGGPSISTSGTAPTLTVDETALGVDDHSSFAGLFTSSYGADGAGSIAYTLGVKSVGVDSGLKDTATGHDIYLYVDGSGNVVGRVGTSSGADPGGAVAFTISVNSSTGDVNLDQSRAIIHPDPTAANEGTGMSDASLVTLTAKITDADSDSQSAAANIGTSFHFLDDEPTMTGHLLPADNFVQVANTVNASDTNSFMLAPGNDGISTATGLGYTIVGPADSSGDYTWAYNDATHTSITESYKGSPLFTISLNSGTGGYTMTMLGTLPYSQLNLDVNNIKAGGPTGSIDVGTISAGGDYVQISGTYNGATGQVNASNANVGVNNGNLDSGEALSFSLFSSTNTLIPVYGLSMGTKTAQGATYHLYGVLDSDHTTIVDLGIQSLAKGGTISYSGNLLLDSIIVTETTGSAVKIGLAGVHLLLPPADAGFHFTAQLTDGDGDYSQLAFNAYVDGDGGGVDHGTVAFPT